MKILQLQYQLLKTSQLLFQITFYNLNTLFKSFQGLVTYLSMSFYRSDLIDHYKLIIPRQNAWQIMNMLGELNIIHIVKSNNPILNKPFTTQIRRCQECLLKIYNLQELLNKKNLYHPRTQFTQIDLISILELISQKHHQLKKQKSISILDQIDEEVQILWNSYQSMKRRSQALQRKLSYYRQNIAMIKAGEKWFGIKSLAGNNSKSNNFNRTGVIQRQISEDYSRIFQNEQGLTVKCGVIDNKQQGRFSRTIFRITRGNCYVRFIKFQEIFQKIEERQQQKSVYFLLFPAKSDSYFQRKLSRFVNNYNSQSGAQSYRLPKDSGQYLKILKQLTDQHNQTQHLLSLVQKQKQYFYYKLLGLDENDQLQESLLHQRGYHAHQFRKIQLMKIYLLKQLQIFNQLNEMELFNNFLQAQIYLKASHVKELQIKLTAFQKQHRQPSGHLIPIDPLDAKSKKKPTLFQTNSYTSSSQQIVQTYGVAQYRQANPSLFTTVTFPFLFGVMFGDIGHGALLFLFGLSLIFLRHPIKRQFPALGMLIPHRYLLTLMGFFATYCGFVYNDFLSINLNLWGSCYNLQGIQQNQPIPRQQNCVYPLGIDPIWAVAQNNLNYINSLKMKISVIIGVIHMTLGVLIKATNSLYFKRKVEFWFEFLPQLIFLVLVFGYMDFLIVFKWLKDWGYDNPHAPSIITTMINLPLALGKTDKQCCHGGQPMWGSANNTSQDEIQVLILLLAIISIPIMLLVKPLYLIKKMKKHLKRGQKARQISDQKEQIFQQEMIYLRQKLFDDEHHEQQIQLAVMQSLKNKSMALQKGSNKTLIEEHERQIDHNEAHQQHEPSQIFVHQMIQTIQFVLGCISNTASYLRLWALSLAHSQLAQVFLEKTLVGSLESGYQGIFGMIILFPFFCGATFGVLMCMDVMECFLHTLRLHWVQFQNKFYKGDGYAFNSFNFLTKINRQVAVQRFQLQKKQFK